MNFVLVDSEDDIVYQGRDAKNVMAILNKEPYEVTEEDEITHGKKLRSIKWSGKLRYEIHINLKFIGIDDWNRPVFKDIDGPIYFGDVNKLFNWETPKEEIIDYYLKDDGGLEYFGQHLGCDPIGGRAEYVKLNIINQN